MTVEERVEWCLDQKGGRPLFGDEAREIIRQALRDQIEDCAKIIQAEIDIWRQLRKSDDESPLLELIDVLNKIRSDDESPLLELIDVLNKIRALAGQTDQTEGKEVER
jgi:hypothetical protein